MRGIAVAGSVLVDRINEISKYPTSGELTKILGIKLATGGCVPNVAIDLKRLCPSLGVYAVGSIGEDGDGEFAKEVLAREGVDTEGLITSDERTSFTEVMSERGGQRTFFTYPGASASFGYSDIDFDALPDMLHLGYFLLLDKIDEGDGERILREASNRGIKTSIDLVSENSDRYNLVVPCLKYTDNLIINEVEAGKLTGIEPSHDNLVAIAKELLRLGVRERVIIHETGLGIVASALGEVTALGSYELPSGFIKGTTGAGDAFCSGALLGIYEGRSGREILEYASTAALGALSEADAISGMRELSELKQLTKELKRKEICL